MGNVLKIGGLSALFLSLIVSAVAQRTIRYTVKEGDSLYAIAHRFGLRLPELLRVNKFRNPHKIKPGDVVYIPVKGASASGKRSSSVRPANGSQSSGVRQSVSRRNPSRTAALTALKGNSGLSPTARRVLEIAHRYLGRPYRYGGSSSRGFDCSGFALHVYRSVGVRLPHSASAQARLGKPVPRSQLQPGDLVFFRTRGRRISHVGIYIGNGRFIHASSARGRVRIDSLNTGYYQRRYVCARRISR